MNKKKGTTPHIEIKKVANSFVAEFIGVNKSLLGQTQLATSKVTIERRIGALIKMFNGCDYVEVIDLTNENEKALRYKLYADGSIV